MSKITFEQWKAECLAFDPNTYHNKKACSKALGKLWSGYQNVKGQGVYDEGRSNEMAQILDEVSKRKDERWGKY